MVEVTELTKTYQDLKAGQFVALDRVSFHVAPGEIFGLLGPNGAGKTTALRILSTVLKPTSGSARVAGFDVNHHPNEVRHSIGFVSNNTAMYERMTAWEFVEYFGKLYGIEAEQLERRMHNIFSDLQMLDIRDVVGAKMSTGMKQKVSIARAIIHDPPVLVFDEPSLGLDVLVARALLKIIGQLRDAGKCIIFSTHIMREVERLCDRVAILYHGRILATGTLAELADRYHETDFEELFFTALAESDQQQVQLNGSLGHSHERDSFSPTTSECL
ncbi:MAG: ATP-binding cassette domain-containing protein [Planctomycetales bacterium]|nr:ATP-binding cassette domain-containing protein [Planctomycetales bacterium]